MRLRRRGERFGEVMIKRTEEGGHRSKSRKLEASEEEVSAMVGDWGVWVEDTDAWWCMVNCEVACEV